MSNFPFIDDEILKFNLDTAFNHILVLVSLTLSPNSNYQTTISSFRKDIIIHTAAIIEALLLWKLKKVCKTNNIELFDDWKYFDISVLHKIDGSTQVVGGTRKKIVKDMDKLDFLRITDLCFVYKIIKTEELKLEIHKVREYRNRLHIGGLRGIEKNYSNDDLNFCFDVAKKVKKIVS